MILPLPDESKVFLFARTDSKSSATPHHECDNSGSSEVGYLESALSIFTTFATRSFFIPIIITFITVIIIAVITVIIITVITVIVTSFTCSSSSSLTCSSPLFLQQDLPFCFLDPPGPIKFYRIPDLLHGLTAAACDLIPKLVPSWGLVVIW